MPYTLVTLYMYFLSFDWLKWDNITWFYLSSSKSTITWSDMEIVPHRAISYIPQQKLCCLYKYHLPTLYYM